MAQIRIYIQPRLPAASAPLAFYDFSNHVQFNAMEWEQNDQGNASIFRANIYSIMPTSTTHWLDYPGATQADKIQAALNDHFFNLKIYPRTEIQVRDVSTSPHTILWGGVVTRVSEYREGGGIVGTLEAIDYTALLSESVALEYTPLANSTIKQTITSQTYSFTPSFAERTAGLASVTVSSISIGSPYSRNLEIGDTIVVNLSDDTYDGVHKVTGVASDGSTYKIRFQQYSNVADSASAAVTGTVKIPGFMTTDNAPQLDSRIRVLSANISDLNPDWKWSPRNPNISRSVSNVARTTTTATITTSAPHGFGVDRVVTISLTNGPTGYADLNGSFVIASTPTDTTFTYTTVTSGTITSGAATGTAVCAGEITPTPMKGGTLARNLQYAVERGTGCFYLNEGSLDGSGNLTIDLFARPKNLVDLVTNGLFDDADGNTTTQIGWDLGLWTADTSGTGGPFGVGNTLYYTGSDHQDAEMSSAYRISVSEGEKYFVSWRHLSDKDAKERPRMKFYDSGGTVVGNSHGIQINQHDPLDNEWHRDWGIVIVPAGAAKMSFVLHHESFSSSYTAEFTDIQITKITGAFGFSDHPIEDTVTYGMTLNDFENPSAPSESGEASNRIYVYAPYTTEDPLTGAKQLTSYRNTYDFAQGVWATGGKRIEGSIVELNATDAATALLTAQKYFKERGLPLRSYEFAHTSGKLNVGDVVPFIWDELGIAEALVVRKQVGYLIGQDVYYRVQLGGDLAFQRSTMYLVEQRLREISGDAAYFSPPPSPYPGYPTEGGIVTPAVPTGDAGDKKVDISWEYPQSIVENASFGGFVVLRSGDAGTNWVKASTGEAILTAQNPLAPDTAVPSFTDSNVEASVGYVYKVAAVDVSGPTPILTEYSTTSATFTPTEPTVDFDNAYSGLGINVPKIVNSVTYYDGYAKNVATITSGASTTATVTVTAGHGMTTGAGEVYKVYIKGAVGTNSSVVNDLYFTATYASSTTFTITKSGTDSLSLTGGVVNIYQVSGDFSDDDGNSRVLGDAWSLVQFPVGQIAYSEGDGKLYRNGKPGVSVFDNFWTRAAVDAIDVSSDGTISISADNITTGTLNAGNVSVTNLSASNITTGTLTSIAINAGSGTFQVTSGGALTATSATITGSVTATSGAIGGWTIASDRITNYGGSSGQYNGIIDTAGSSGLAFFAGATDTAGSNATFSVTNAGLVEASNLVLEGPSSTIGTTGSAGRIIMKAVSGQVGAVIEAQTSSGSTTGSVLALRAGGTGTTGTLGDTIGAVMVYDGTSDQGTLITGGLMISNDYSKAGTASFPLPKDGVIVFTDSVTSAYTGGGDLYQNPINTLRTSGNFAAGGTISATGDISTSGSLVSNGGDVFIDGTSTEDPTLTYRDSANTVFGTLLHNGANFALSDALAITGTLSVSSTLTASSTLNVTGVINANSTASIAVAVDNGVSVGAIDGIYFGTVTTDANLYYSSSNWRFTQTGTGTGAIDAVWTVNGTGASALVRGSVSARKYKENIVEQQFSLGDVFALRPVTYDIKDEYLDRDEDGNVVGMKGPHLGVIADDAVGNPAWERLVVRDADTGEVDMFNYKIMGVVLLDAGKKMYEKIIELEARIAELES